MKNIDIDIDMAILENIDKGILQNIDIDKISYRLGFGISNTPTSNWYILILYSFSAITFCFQLVYKILTSFSFLGVIFQPESLTDFGWAWKDPGVGEVLLQEKYTWNTTEGYKYNIQTKSTNSNLQSKWQKKQSAGSKYR